MPPLHHLLSAISSHNCACACVRVWLCLCARVSYCVQALLSFSCVWTAGRVVLIGQNDAEMDRKPLWSSWSSFSPSLTFTLSLRLNHGHTPLLPHPLASFLSSPLHHHCSASSALAVKRPQCCSTNFHIPLFLLFGHFPKALWASGGKLLATDYSYMVISPCFAPLLVFLAGLSFHFYFCWYLAVLFVSLTSSPLSGLPHSVCPWSVCPHCPPACYPKVPWWITADLCATFCIRSLNTLA